MEMHVLETHFAFRREPGFTTVVHAVMLHGHETYAGIIVWRWKTRYLE
jgi:hypothetical protein